MQNAVSSVFERRLACPDCPACRVGAPPDLLPGHASSCAFESIRVEARTPLPDRWHETTALALVRRGIVVRQRVDARGRVVTIDAAGIGNVVPIDAEGGARIWAVTDSVLCLLPTHVADRWSELRGADVTGVMRTILERVERIAEARGRNTSISRAAMLLCVLADTLTPSPRTHVPAELPQRTIAALAGIRQESVCRAIKRLLKRGVIERDGRGLRIVDRAALEAI